MMQHNDNSLIPVSEGVTAGNLKIMPNNSSQIISATNNRAQYFAEQAKKYKEDACNYMLTAKEYAESNTNITQGDLNDLSDNIIGIINDKESLLIQDIDDIEGVIQNITPESLVGKNGLYLTTNGENLSWGNVVEYSEYSQTINDLGSTKVNKSGDTITGALNINNAALNINASTNFMNLRATEITDSTSTPISNTYCGIQFNDNNGTRFGKIEGTWDTGGYTSMALNASRNINGTDKYAAIKCWVDSDGRANYSPVQLITSYMSGTSGYNIWSNGYCEQWGYFSSEAWALNQVCTFVKTYRDTNFNARTTVYQTKDRDGYAYWMGTITGRSVNSITIHLDTNAYYNGCYWKVSGYLAEGEY